MSGRFGFWEIVALAAALQGVLLAGVVGTHRRGNRVANRLLGTLLFLYSAQLFEIVLYWTRALERWPHLWGISWFLPYLYGPLLYFYARSLEDPSMRWQLKRCWHLAPFLACILLYSRFYALSAEIKGRILASSYPGQGDGDIGSLGLIVWLVQFLHFTGYLALSARRLRPAAGDAFQNLWLRRLFIAFGVSFACWFVNGLAVGLGSPYLRFVDYGASLAMTSTIYAIGYAALRQPELFLGPLKRMAPAAKYEKSNLTPDQAATVGRRLLELMAARKPYRDSDLRLGDLAQQLEVHPHHLSQLINQRFKCNFNAFVNLYRVEEARKLLEDPSRRSDSLLDLAFEVGFNNKTSFNQAFKKHAGMTPSRYRSQVEA